MMFAVYLFCGKIISLSQGRGLQQLIVNIRGDYTVNIPEITQTLLALEYLRQVTNSTAYLLRKCHLFTEIICQILVQ